MIGYSKRIEKIIRESAFDNMKKKPGLIFNPKLALSGVRTTGPWVSTEVRGQIARVGERLVTLCIHQCEQGGSLSDH